MVKNKEMLDTECNIPYNKRLLNILITELLNSNQMTLPLLQRNMALHHQLYYQMATHSIYLRIDRNNPTWVQ